MKIFCPPSPNLAVQVCVLIAREVIEMFKIKDIPVNPEQDVFLLLILTTAVDMGSREVIQVIR